MSEPIEEGRTIVDEHTMKSAPPCDFSVSVWREGADNTAGRLAEIRAATEPHPFPAGGVRGH